MCFSDHVFDLRKRSRTFFGECPYCYGKCLKIFGKEHGRHGRVQIAAGLSPAECVPSFIRPSLSIPDTEARIHALGRSYPETGRTPGTCITADRPSVEAENAENPGKRRKHGTFRRGLGGPYLYKRTDVSTERQEKAGTGWHRGFQGCFSRIYSPRLLRLSRHGALRQLLPRVQGEGGELGGPGCPLSPQSGQPAVCPGQAHVCRAPADPPQERSLMAERESVPEGKDGEHGVRQIPVILLQKNLLVRENPQKTGGFRPLATLLFILLLLIALGVVIISLVVALCILLI